MPTPSVVNIATPAATKPTDNSLLRLRTRPRHKIAPTVVAIMHHRVAQIEADRLRPDQRHRRGQ